MWSILFSNDCRTLWKKRRNKNAVTNFVAKKYAALWGKYPLHLFATASPPLGLCCFVSLLWVISCPTSRFIQEQQPYTAADSVDIAIFVKFDNKRPGNITEQMLCLQLPNGTFTGQIQNLSSVRDTLDRQEILCRFKSSEIKSVENQTLDFQIVHSSGNLLQKMLGRLW